MDERAVRQWLAEELDVSRETFEKLDLFVSLLEVESRNQNLIAKSTMEIVWERHLRDSAQLLMLADPALRSGRWIDLGSGPGLPGIVLALIGDMAMTLVEVRKRRVEFLQSAIERLQLGHRVRVEGRKLERVETRPMDVITARAFAALPQLFALAHRFSHAHTQWILPKGRRAQEELEAARGTWQGDFSLEPSLTDSDAFIIVAHKVKPRRRS
ncbi:16S rRNA (guanine(527)-N(7))-methyltransferase RsmG [Parasphingopyxis sp.]|uniref:16S rRNA (guanine(527)-N(7))-methyltransferase RsmG n=1 Tax=Parasphingopyxis sp. TaxID=1920299 RepID=UPI002611CB90|nr:16S rRNA (guanine(527)-N(7))-methyltransferase RsmG [Parasphingopyxis sp.]